MVGIHRENAFVEHAMYALERWPQFAGTGCEGLEHADGACTAHGEKYHSAQLHAGLMILVEDIVDALHERVASGDDVAHEQRSVGIDVILLIADIEPCYHAFGRDYSFARQETHVIHLYSALMATFFERIVESAAQYGENIRLGGEIILLKIL